MNRLTRFALILLSTVVPSLAQVPPGTGGLDGSTDPNFKIIAESLQPHELAGATGNAVVVNNLPAWAAALPGTKWIAPAADQSNGLRGTGFKGSATYQTSFTVSANLTLNVRVLADDSVTMSVNGGQTATTNGSSSLAGTLQAKVTKGANTIVFVVSNLNGGPTGLDVSFSDASAAPAGPYLGFSYTNYPGSVTFAPTAAGSISAPGILTISNNGDAPATFAKIVPTAGFALDAASQKCPATLNPGSQCTLGLVFKPTASSPPAPTGSLDITLNGTANPQSYSVPLSGSLPAAACTGSGAGALTYSPAALTFPATPAGSVSAEQIVKIANTGCQPAVFSDYTIPSNYSIDYSPATSLVAGCNPSTDKDPNLQGGASCAIGLTYRPTTAAPVVDPFIGSNLGIDLCPPCGGTFYKLPLNGTTGNGPILIFTPRQLVFPDTPAGGSSTMDVRIVNTGNTPATFTSLPKSSVFQIEDAEHPDSCLPALAVADNCILHVTFRPPVGSSGVLSADSTSNPPNPLLLTVTGGVNFALNAVGAVAAGAAVLSATPDHILITAAAGGQNAQGPSITLKNTGSGPVTNIQFSSTGTGISYTGQFGCGVLSAGATCSFDTSFSPPAKPGVVTGTIDLAYTAAGNAGHLSIPATGVALGASEAPALTASPSSFSITGKIGGGSYTGPNVTVTNNSTSVVTIDTFHASDTHLGYSNVGVCYAPLAPKATCTFGTFLTTPTAPGTLTGTITLDYSANGSESRLAIGGTGTAVDKAPAVTVLDSNGSAVGGSGLSFVTNVGTTLDKQIAIQNSGDASLSIASVTLADATGAYTVVNNNCGGVSLDPGLSCKLIVRFIPQTYGPAIASLNLVDNVGSQQIRVEGNGTGPALLTLSSRSLNFTSVVGGAAPPAATLTIQNVGGSNAVISGIGHSNLDSGFVYDLTGCFGRTLKPAATDALASSSCKILITFKPSVAGDAGDIIGIISDAPSNPDLVVLFGSGVCGAAVKCDPPPVIPSTRGYRTLSLDAAADPVDGAMGDFYDTFADLHTGGPIGMDFNRYYSSGLSVGGYTSSLGTNWMHNYDLRLARKGTDAQVILFRGKVVSFSKTSGTWQLTDPSTIGYQFAEAAGGFQFYSPESRLVYSFDSAGRLAGLANSGGYQQIVTQGDFGPTQVSDGQGRSLTFTYQDNLLSSVRDQAGRSVTFTYDSALLSSATAPDNAVTKYTYTNLTTAAGLMVRRTYPAGNAPVTQTYGASGKVVKQTDASGNETNFAYDGKGGTTISGPLGDVTTQANNINGDIGGLQDPAGASGKFGYDNSFRRTSVTDRLGNSILFTYHAPTGKLASLTDEAGNTTNYSYSPFSNGNFMLFNLTGIQYADGTSSSFTYDAGGMMTGMVQRDGSSKTFAYDDRKRLTSLTDPEGNTSTYTYNSDGTMAAARDAMANVMQYSYAPSRQVSSVTNANGGVSAFTYDSAGRLLTTQDPAGDAVTIHYNANGFRDKWTSPTGAAYSYTYNPMNHIAAYADPLGNATKYLYDAENRLSSITNAAGETSKFTYDAGGHITALSNNQGVAASYTYDAEGQLTSFADANGAKTSFTYSPAGQVTATTLPSGGQRSMSYDKFGLLLGSTNPLGETDTLTRDAMGRVNAVQAHGGIGTSTQYTAAGRVAAITSPNGNTWKFGYDADGRISAYTDPLGNVTTNTYTGLFRTGIQLPLGSAAITNDALGRATNTTFSDGTSINMAYDAAGMLAASDGVSTTRDAKGRPSSINGLGLTYTASDRPASITYAPGKTVTYGYDADGRVVSVTDWNGGRTTVAYDAAGRPAVTTYPNGIATSYTYDADGRILGIAAGNAGSIALTRDADGKILSADRNLPTQPALQGSSQQFLYDAAGRLATPDASSDAMGRALAESGRSFTWNLANQLTAFGDASTSVALTYDGLGELSSSTATGLVQAFVFNHASDFPALSIVRQGGADLRYYVYMPNGKLLYSIEAADNSRQFFHFDEMGNTAFLTGDDGAVTDTYAITPYGDVADHSGPSDNPFTWQGQYGVMQETPGLYYLRTRHYDAALGRFLSPDRMVQSDPRSAEPYIYARGNPLYYIDPFGDLGWGDVGSFLNSVGNGLVNGVKAVGTAAVVAGTAAYNATVSAGAAVGNAISTLTHPAPARAAAPRRTPPQPVTLPPAAAVVKYPPVLISNTAALRLCTKSKTANCPASLVSALQAEVDAGEGSRLIGQDGNNLIGQDGNNLIGQDGNNLIGQDGNNLIGQDGNGLTQADLDFIAGLVNKNGSNLVNTNGSNLSRVGVNVVSHDGGTVISNDGGTVVSNDGGTVISNDGGTIVAQGGLN